MNITPAAVVLPDELIADILSRLPVKSLTRLRCVSKSWNTLISDPSFVYMHLHRSKRNPHLTLMWDHNKNLSRFGDYCVVSLPVRRLLENPLTTVQDDPCYRLKDKDCCWVVGSCNGLLCLLCYSFSEAYPDYWLRFWNPATRITSEKLGFFRDFGDPLFGSFKFTFGYDNSTGIYKVVAFRMEGHEEGTISGGSEVRVFSLGDNSWRNIQNFPVVPLNWYDLSCTHQGVPNDGVHLGGTLNWLALPNPNYLGGSYYFNLMHITVEQFVILSLDLSTETYKQLLLPQGFDEVPCVKPTVGVLMDCLCFSHDFKRTDFVVWQMTEFGVQESWTQLLKISYQNLQIYGTIDEFQWLPLCLSENGDTMILANANEEHAIIYNWRDKRVERTRSTDEIRWFWAKDYVESLVSTL